MLGDGGIYINIEKSSKGGLGTIKRMFSNSQSYRDSTLVDCQDLWAGAGVAVQGSVRNSVA